MDRLESLWGEYAGAKVPEWNHPIDARDFLQCIQRFQKDWYRGHISELEIREMIQRSSARLVWIPPKFHEAARIDTGLFPLYNAIELNRYDASQHHEFLSFVEEMDLTTFENRCIHLPFSSDFYYLLRGQAFDVCRKHLNYDRLAWVKQLAYLGMFYSIQEKGLPDPNPHDALHHSRMQHSLLVSSLIEIVMTRLGYDEHAISESVFAAMVHDLATPGLGDTVKKLDKKGLDEELHLRDAIPPQAREVLKKQLGIDAGNIFRIVDGTLRTPGTALLHSSQLDLDKIAYTALDANHYLLMCEYDRELPEWNDELNKYPEISKILRSLPLLYERIKEITSAHPALFDIYKDVDIVKDAQGTDVAVFSDHEKVYQVLKLRGLLSAKLYMAPESRAKEAGYFFHLFSPLYGRGVFTAENLRQMTDREAAFTLMATLGELEGLTVGYGKNSKGLLVPYQTKDSSTYLIDMGEGHAVMRYFKPFTIGAQPYLISKHETEVEARLRASTFGSAQDGVYVRHFKGFNAGENTLVKDNMNDIVPLHCVRKAQEINELISLRDETTGWFVLAPNPDFKDIFSDIRELHAKARANPRGNVYPPTELWPDL